MSVHFPKVISIDLEESDFDEVGGYFYFKLDGKVENRWKQYFRDAAQQEGASCFNARQPTVHGDEYIVAYADIDGENDLRTVNHHVKHAVAVANAELREVVDYENAEENRKQADRRKLEQRVAKIVGSLRFD
ncbi:hypothetical protein [uncultured Pantoea sp.]|uniref:hypothetical protein n=1 Tax=uncultured Pantoea sp. TaxID=218084 RepID=UPI0025879594|nr:hypothetical protein [uncultured Pantoea sp.]